MRDLYHSGRRRTEVAAAVGPVRAGQNRRSLLPIALAGPLILVLGAGCSNFAPGVFSYPGDSSSLSAVGPGVALPNADSEAVYHKVREAAAQNSVVLEVVGNKQTLRVLPLPPEGQSVFVSTLLNDTGVLAKLGTIEATLYRNSPHAMGGVRMDVKMSPGQDAVSPESDYALRAGDRLQVRKAEYVALSNLIDATIGL